MKLNEILITIFQLLLNEKLIIIHIDGPIAVGKTKLIESFPDVYNNTHFLKVHDDFSFLIAAI